MKEIDQIYTAYPFYGKRRISITLKQRGLNIGVDRTRTLMQRMGIAAIYPKPNLSRSNPEHKIYPYLLRGMNVSRRDQVWSTDITYIPMVAGFFYLTAIIDWFTRYILAWELSNLLDGKFCRNILEKALTAGKPEIFNTDQGAQYTSNRFTEILTNHGVKISMDGKGRALDNIYIERFWRSLKYEEVYINDYRDGIDAHKGLESYIDFYNTKRPHSSLNHLTPGELYHR